jgi:threonine/homoserine/homoserine lactone efflux protein
MEINLLLSFLGASILLSFMPGPDNIYVLSESLSRGAKTGILISIGLVSGVLIHTSLAATGLSLIIYKSEIAFKIVSYIGGAYLIYLAFMASREKPIGLSSANEDETSRPRNAGKLIMKGFVMNVSNPKVSLFFIAFLPRFVNPEGGNIVFQMLILGFVFIVQALVIFSAIALLAGKFSQTLNNNLFWKYTKVAKVIILGGLGINLLIF